MKWWYTFILLSALLMGCSGDSETETIADESTANISQIGSFGCGAENTTEDDGKLKFITSNENVLLDHGHTQSSDFARSGEYSIKLDSTNRNGFKYTFNDLKEGEFLRFSVWQKTGQGNGVLILRSNPEDENLEVFDHLELNAHGEWAEHHISMIVTEGVHSASITAHVPAGVTYFDDFEFERLAEVPRNDLLPELNLVMDDTAAAELDSNVRQARKGKVIQKKYKKYVPASLQVDDQLLPARVKIKGDWTDHISSGKISLRIKMKGNHAYHGLKSFSVQHPKTRKYLDEWIVHKMADEIDLLTTTFEMVNVVRNDIYCGVFALEEHFDKQLVESRNRREGPILKFDEDGIWQIAVEENPDIDIFDFPYYEASRISVFKKNRTRKSESLSKNFEEGAKLLMLYKNGTEDVGNLFDMEQMAKYYVLMDLCGGHHSLAWHNRRFYFNPITQKLEHILFDVMPWTYGEKFQNSIEYNLDPYERVPDQCLGRTVVLNREFKDYYMRYMKLMSSEEFLDSLFSTYEGKLDTLTRAIQTEEPVYTFDKDRYYRRAEHMRKIYSKLDGRWNSAIANMDKGMGGAVDKTYPERTDTSYFDRTSLNAYLHERDSTNYEVDIENYHVNDITIHGYELANWPRHAIAFEDPITLEGYAKVADQFNLNFDSKPKSLFYTVSNKPGRYYRLKFIPWKKPQGNTSRRVIELRQKEIQPYVITGGKAVFTQDVTIDQLHFVPKDLPVEIKAGVTITFEKNGGLIVSNNFTAIGDSLMTIKFVALDSMNHGLTILGADKTEMKYVEFSGLSNLDYENWELSGAVNIYESEVKLSDIKVSANYSEDALNIIRSNFDIDRLTIDQTTSDGFDSDFCTGSLKNSIFMRTGNDCVDLSGSEVEIIDCIIQQSGDKGISIGEHSKVKLTNVRIEDAIFGIASKDLSEVYGENIQIIHTSCGLLAFCKKAEYGPASMLFDDLVFTETEKQYFIEKGSVLHLNGEEIAANIAKIILE